MPTKLPAIRLYTTPAQHAAIAAAARAENVSVAEYVFRCVQQQLPTLGARPTHGGKRTAGSAGDA